MIVPAAYAAFGVLGFVVLFQFDSSDDYAGWTLVFAVLHVIWWAAIERPSPTRILPRGRRITACVLATVLVGLAAGGMPVAIADAIAQHEPALAPLALLSLAAIPTTLGVCGWLFARLLAREDAHTCERRLLLAISAASALALAVDFAAARVAQSSGQFLAGLVGAMLAIGAGLTLAWCVLPWIVWAVGEKPER